MIPQEKTTICSVKLSKEDVQTFSMAVANHYWYFINPVVDDDVF
jgi:hypothetical protein